MLTVTDAAKALLAEVIAERGLPEEISIRLSVGQEGLDMTGDSRREADVAFDHEGRAVLLLDPQASELLTSHTLDSDGSELTLRPPTQDEQPGA